MNERVQIAINNAGKTYFYTGVILDETETEITIHDEKDGPITLYKTALILKKVLPK